MRIEETFPKLRGKVLFGEPLFKHTTFHIGGPCRIWVEPSSEEELTSILRFARLKRKKIFIIGKGSNVLFRDRGFNGIVIHMGNSYFKKVKFIGTKVIVGAGVLLQFLVNLACKKGMKGIEGLIGIPGTLGGAVFMNASFQGSISDCLEKIKVMNKNNGHISIIKRKYFKFGYRHSNLDKFIILEAVLRLKHDDKKRLLKRKIELLKIKKRKQPFGSFNAGCIFKNPAGNISAAQYIDRLGLGGRRINDAKISEKHANFIINLKNTKARDVLGLINLIRKRVKSRFNVTLDTEIIIV